MMIGSQHEQEPQATSMRQLEEILQDPNANWSDIRKAMKARGQSACTNAALLRALANDVSTINDIPHRHGSSTAMPNTSAAADVKSGTTEDKETDPEDKHPGSEDEEYDEYVIETFQEPRNSDNPRRLPRRRSRNSAKMSINMMDFGVDHFGLEDDDEESISVVSCESNYSCDSNGFLGWKHNSEDEASVNSNLSGLCDPDGFLNWEFNASARSKKGHDAAKLAELKDSITSQSTNLSKKCDADGFLAWEMSSSARAASALEAENISKAVEDGDIIQTTDSDAMKVWRIEDYEGANDNESTKPSDQGRTHLSFLSTRLSNTENTNGTFWKNLFQAPHANASHDVSKNDHSELNNVKQALMKRCSLQNAIENATEKQSETQAVKPNLLKHIQQLNSAKPAYITTEYTNSTHRDTREAIWIKRTDGDVDIEKECRKLYLKDHKDKETGKVAKYIRRASLHL
jgi:hypothetical protein